MRAALADLKVLPETGLLDDDGYLAAQQKWIARLAAGDVQEADGGETRQDDIEIAMAREEPAGSATLATALPTVPDQHGGRRR